MTRPAPGGADAGDHDGPRAGLRPPDASHAWPTLGLSSLAVLATFLDTTVLFVAFPDIRRSFPSVSAASLSWVLNGYTIAFAASVIPAGKIADRVGHKRSFLAGSAAFTLASLGCAAAPSVGALVAVRIAQAVAAALLIPSSLALVMRAFSRDRLAVAVAIWGAAGAVAGALGPTLGASLVEAASWRWVFLVNLPVGLVAVAGGIRILRESKDDRTVVPAPLGVALVASAAALVTLGMVQSGSWGWSDPRTAVVVACGVALLALFVLHQSRTAAPTLDLTLFRSANFTWANAATAVFGVAFSAMFFGSMLFMTNVWQWSTLRAGLGLSPGPILVAVLVPVLGRLAAKIGQRPLLLAGGVAFAAGGVWRLFTFDAQPEYLRGFLPSILLAGLGVALCLPQLSSVVAQDLPPERFGVGGAANQAIRQFGGTLGVALTIGVLGEPATVRAALTTFDRVWAVLIVGGVATSVLSVPLRTRRRDAAPTSSAAAGDVDVVDTQEIVTRSSGGPVQGTAL